MDVQTQQATLLIVDDNPNNIQLLKAILSLRGYQLLVAKNGIQALEYVKTVLPDLIIMDIMMPEMDGFEACQHLKGNPATQNIPIIFLTAKTHIDDIMKGFELGAVDYISKPFSTNELVARVEIHLKLKFSQDMVIKQRNELREMVQILCHDLSNPLGAVMTSFELSEFDPDYLNQNKNLIMSYITKQYEIIGMVRDLRAIAEKRSTLSLAPVDVLATMKDSLETLHFRLIDKHITTKLDIDEGLQIIAEKVSLVNSVFNNLLTNAIKFSYPDTTIFISAKRTGRLVEISITDKGIGIPENLLDKLFDIDRTTTRYGTQGEKSTGFGMPLVKKFITAYGATLDVISKDETIYPEDHGTTINLKFRIP